MTAEEYRRAVGMDMLEAERRANEYRIAKAKASPKPAAVGQCKQGVVIGAANPHLLPPDALYFTSLDDFLAWCDSEGGEAD